MKKPAATQDATIVRTLIHQARVAQRHLQAAKQVDQGKR
jgi:hypothetical protein